MRIKLHYAELNNQGDIPCLKFETLEDLKMHIFGYDDKNVVYLFSFDGEETPMDSEVFITHSSYFLYDFLKHFQDELNLYYISDFFLQEYQSYEEAYRVALMMKETNPLCYNK